MTQTKLIVLFQARLDIGDFECEFGFNVGQRDIELALFGSVWVDPCRTHRTS